MHAVLPLCVWSKWDSFLAAKAVMAWSLPAPATDGQDYHSLEPAAPLYATPPGGRRLFLYKSRRILRAEIVRLSLLVLAFLALATASYAQEQERKLVDRLLSPNTKLANHDQNKKFAGGSEAPTRSAATKSFYVSEKNLSKAFVADRSAPTTSFRARNYST